MYGGAQQLSQQGLGLPGPGGPKGRLQTLQQQDTGHLRVCSVTPQNRNTSTHQTKCNKKGMWKKKSPAPPLLWATPGHPLYLPGPPGHWTGGGGNCVWKSTPPPGHERVSHKCPRDCPSPNTVPLLVPKAREPSCGVQTAAGPAPPPHADGEMRAGGWDTDHVRAWPWVPKMTSADRAIWICCSSESSSGWYLSSNTGSAAAAMPLRT